VIEQTAVPDTTVDEAKLAAALAGDPEAFRELTDRYRREIHLHCYRMLGSFHDAEDGVQETLLRAWRHLATFEGRSSFRSWLYRIATNVCLTQRTRRPTTARKVPETIEAIPRSHEPALALSPYPDALLDELEVNSADPIAEYDLRESVQLAFLASVQLLPPRQRAALILHDVVGFSAVEVAQLLDSTTASVNSALNRARTTIAHQREIGRLNLGRAVPTDDVAESLVQRYVEAWLAMDIGKLVGLLKRDVIMTMPPLPVRYDGRRVVIEFLITIPVRDERERFRFIPTRANRQPAVAVYRSAAGADTYRGWGIFVLTADDKSIAEITAFVDPKLLAAFGLPAEIGGHSVTGRGE
jgi:RNA polymerase sigma-70 factor (ECF subfamily)